VANLLKFPDQSERIRRHLDRMDHPVLRCINDLIETQNRRTDEMLSDVFSNPEPPEAA